MPYKKFATKGGTCWLDPSKPYAVNSIYMTGLDATDERVDANVVLLKQASHEATREACLELVHDRVVIGLGAYTRIDVPYDALSNGMFDLMVEKWRPEEELSFIPFMLDRIKKQAHNDNRTEQRYAWKRAAHAEEIAGAIMCICAERPSVDYDVALGLIRELDARDMFIMCAWLGIDLQQGTHAYIARCVGVTRGRVSQRVKELIEQMRRGVVDEKA